MCQTSTVAYTSPPEELERKERSILATPAGFSGLKGKALALRKEDYPTKGEVMAVIPKECLQRDTLKSLMYLLFSTVILFGFGGLAYAFIPFTLPYLPLWLAYGAANGTVAFGFWVVGHECGHGAFSDNKTLQDAVGFAIHSFCLTPYFSWQRSHAVHHSRVNHMHEGETHVPNPTEDSFAATMHAIKEFPLLGGLAHDLLSLTLVSVGFVFYLVFGASGGPAYKPSNHFWPVAPFETKLFPGKWKRKVILSAMGVFGMMGLLYLWCAAEKSIWPVAAVYVGPYLGLNAWLGIVTKLHHTDVDVPHLEGDEWNWVRGAFLTIDRPYYKIVDILQHHIGSTHVAHHLCPQIPHYHAVKATECIKKAFPHLYLYDPTPVHWALLRVCSKCISVENLNNMWVYTNTRKKTKTT
ncbi:fatty acid desaturase [Chloropicon primus]|nr:fatty acid desaturase [Chloropicon primus]